MGDQVAVLVQDLGSRGRTVLFEHGDVGKIGKGQDEPETGSNEAKREHSHRKNQNLFHQETLLLILITVFEERLSSTEGPVSHFPQLMPL
jgi:hypothetical protein